MGLFAFRFGCSRHAVFTPSPASQGREIQIANKPLPHKKDRHGGLFIYSLLRCGNQRQRRLVSISSDAASNPVASPEACTQSAMP